jgi:hypothetical protein
VRVTPPLDKASHGNDEASETERDEGPYEDERGWEVCAQHEGEAREGEACEEETRCEEDRHEAEAGGQEATRSEEGASPLDPEGTASRAAGRRRGALLLLRDLPMWGSPRPGRPLHEACFAALSQLDREGVFGQGAERDRVIVNVVYGDMSDERWLAHAERLNPKARSPRRSRISGSTSTLARSRAGAGARTR